ncbi:MAG: flagellar biosynthetic protein FliR [Planctomycetaceae bacterium]
MDNVSPQLELLVTTLLTAWSGTIGLVWLTVARFLGLVMTAPLLSSPAVMWRTRIAIGVVMGICCGLASGTTSNTPLAVAEVDLVWAGLVEIAIGAAIGFGAKLLLCGLELAGSLIDQQAGLSGTTTSLLEEEGGGSISVSALTVLAGMVWLLLSPLGGDLRLIAALLDSLQALPPGTATDLQTPIQLVRGLLSAACLFGLQVAAPIVLSLGLLQLFWNMMARSRGGGLWQPALSPLRLFLTLLLLAATVTDLGTALAERVDGWVQYTAASFTTVSAEVGP